MKIGYCQYAVAYKAVEENLNTVTRMLENVEGDLIVLPELAFTGYSFTTKEELAGYATKEVNDAIVARLHTIARKKKLAIIAGMAEFENGCLYNAAFVITEAGLVGKYRKINLTKNETIFTAGTELNVFELKGVKIGVVICFDSWFPESFRVLAKKGAEIICCPANFGGHWTLDVAKVRSLENTVYTILSNRTGTEVIAGESSPFRGESMIVDYQGEVILSAHANEHVGMVEVFPHENTRNKNIICDDMETEKKKYNHYVQYKD